jgi:broad-specificity NMP kinase
MKILITGTSGTGKSAVGAELKKRGFDVIDTDQDVFNDLSIAYWVSKTTGEGVHMPWPPPEDWHNENDWVWRVNILNQRLDSNNNSIVFACGDSRNKKEAYSLFDKILVLDTEDDVLRERIQARHR